jgi:hypothetical protein
VRWAAPVSKKRIGLNRAPNLPMGFVWRGPSIMTVASRPEGFAQIGQVGHSVRRRGILMCWGPTDHPREAACETCEPGNNGESRERPAVLAAIVDVALRKGAKGWRQRLCHELSHHIGGRGGGHGDSLPWGSIRPPQQGHASTSWPVRSRSRSCQRGGGFGSGGGGTASRSRQSASLAVRWRLARNPM